VKKINSKRKVLISICVPVLNEEKNLTKLHTELCAIARTVQGNSHFEFIFTDNNSSDNSWKVIKELSKNDPRVRGYRFARNIGFQRSIYFGYMQAKGNAIVQIDADLQDPPETILKFLKSWQEGYKVVVGIRRKRAENLFMRKFRNFGYALISKLARFEITKNAGDFRLIDREVVEILRKSNNPHPYLRGAIAGMGFSEKGIFYDRRQRTQGNSKIGLTSVVKLGFTGLINYSNVLSKLAVMIFTVSLTLSIVGMLVNLSAKFNTSMNNVPPGFTTVVILLFIVIAVNSLFFAILIHYLQQIHIVVTNENQVVVTERID
jgi:dolichol-phosphate mannosyltransferase